MGVPADQSDPGDLWAIVRSEGDPVRRFQLAGQLRARLQQFDVEVSRLRRQAIDEAAANGIAPSQFARLVNLSRGRISQIRGAGPAVEREFFGVGPVEVGIPERSLPGRAMPGYAAEDVEARVELARLLADLVFDVDLVGIPDVWQPSAGHDLVAICGPKSSATIAQILATDPVWTFTTSGQGRWSLTNNQTGENLTSPADDPEPVPADIAYLGRLRFDRSRTVVVIAGIHAIGSLGAVHYLADNLPGLYRHVGANLFSTVITSSHDGLRITHSDHACQPTLH